jgi:hypothetical protein
MNGEVWRPTEDALLRERYPALGIKRVAALFPHRTLQAVRARICALKLKRRKPDAAAA